MQSSNENLRINENLLTVALIQQPPVFFNTEQSLKRLSQLIIEAKQSHSELGLVVVPESWLGGYPVWLDLAPQAALWDHPGAKELYQRLVEQALTVPGSRFQRLSHLAKQHDVYLVIGFHEKRGHTLYNTQAFIAPDGCYKLHRKLTPTYTEKLIWGVGDGSTLEVLPSHYGNIGGLICWEHWMPQARAAMHAQQESLHIAQWPYVKEMHLIASRHYAFEGRCFVLASGCFARTRDLIDGLNSLADYPAKSPGKALLLSMTDHIDDVVLQAGSAVIHPDGKVVATLDYNQSDTLICSIDLSEIIAQRMTLDTNGHYSRPDIFSLEVNTHEQVNVKFSA